MKKIMFLVCLGIIYLCSCKPSTPLGPTISEQIVGTYAGISKLDSIHYSPDDTTTLYFGPDTIVITPGYNDNSITIGGANMVMHGSNGIFSGWDLGCCNSFYVNIIHDSLKTHSQGPYATPYSYKSFFWGVKIP